MRVIIKQKETAEIAIDIETTEDVNFLKEIVQVSVYYCGLI